MYRYSLTLDAMVNGITGLQAMQFKLVNGYETDISINVISTFLLGLLILPKLQESARHFDIQPTLTIVASDTHYIAQVRRRSRRSQGKKPGVMADQRAANSSLSERRNTSSKH
jgi:hypothetical protein